MKASEVAKREKCLDDAIAFIKSKGFGYIKLELEANLGRRNKCNACGGSGRNYARKPCLKCDGLGIADVVDGKLVQCTNCDKGLISCIKEHRDWDSVDTCKNYIKSKLKAETLQHLTYMRFYHDGSVDSELTFTMPIEHVRDCIDVINGFINLAEAIGNGVDTRGAGMHIALLNSSNGNYPAGNNLNAEQLENLKRNINKLMPALYFLGSADHRSRRLGYREPRVSSSKYSAINYGRGVLEYRVFETCYVRPTMLFEFVEVIAKTLVYYDEKKSLPLSVLNRPLRFTAPLGSTVERFYRSKDSLKALELTLPYLKPESRTIEQLKQERGFKLDANKLNVRELVKKRQTEWEWSEYERRARVLVERETARYKKQYEANPPARRGYTLDAYIKMKLNIKDQRTFLAEKASSTRSEERSALTF